MANLKVSPGDDITAALHNQIVDRLPGSKAGRPAIVGGMNHCWVPVQNDTEEDFEEGDLVSVLDWQGPTNKIYDTQQAIEFLIEEADPDDTGLTYGVCLAPIAAGQPGRAVVAGVAHVNLTITDTDHRYAILDSENPRSLTSASYGPWKIMDSVSGDRGFVIFHADPPKLVKFELTDDWDGFYAEAEIRDVLGGNALVDLVWDPVSLFSDLSIGGSGLAILQAGRYFVVHADRGSHSGSSSHSGSESYSESGSHSGSYSDSHIDSESDSHIDSESDKSTAIVPASWTPGGYTALFTLEAPEVRFDDVMTIKTLETDFTIPVDPQFFEVCEKGTIAVCGAVADVPVAVGASIDKGTIRIRLADHAFGEAVITIRLTAVRRDFAGKRFPNRTREQFEHNERFLRSAYPGAGQ